MKKLWILLSFILVLNSCATILNSRYKAMTIYTHTPAKVIIQKDTIHSEYNEAHFLVPRSKNSLTFQLLIDTVTTTLSIPAKNSFAYYLNIPYNYGLGMFVDQGNPKRFTYPRRVYLDSSWQIQTFPLTRKGDFNFQVSLPYINTFLMQPAGRSLASSTGFWGFGLGVDYYHQNQQYLSLNLRAASDFPLPILVPIAYREGDVFTNSNYLSLSNHHRHKRFDWGYGLSWIENKWGQDFYGGTTDTLSTPQFNRERHQALGLNLSAYYFTGRSFHLGLIYRPSFVRLYINPVYKYEHLISLELAWKIRP